MAPIIPRRGMIRPISDLPSLASSVAYIEVEGADGHFYKATSAELGGAPLWTQTAMQITLAAPLGTQAFQDETGKVTGATGSVVAGVAPNVPGGIAAVYSGAGGQVTVQSSDDFNFSCDDFTLEGFFQTTQNAQQYTTLCEKDNGAFGAGSWSLLINNGSASDGVLAFYANGYDAGGGLTVATSTGGYNDGQRHHVAVSKIGMTFNIWVDGIRRGVVAFSSFGFTLPNSAQVLLGNSVFASRAFIGILDNWRFIRGNTAYSVSPFTVPTPPFPIGA